MAGLLVLEVHAATGSDAPEVTTGTPGTVQVPPRAHVCPLTVVAAPLAALPLSCVCTDDVGSAKTMVAGATPSTVLLVNVWVSVVPTLAPAGIVGTPVRLA